MIAALPTMARPGATTVCSRGWAEFRQRLKDGEAVIAAVAEKFANALSHGTLPMLRGWITAQARRDESLWHRAMETRCELALSSKRNAMDANGTPDAHARQRRTSLFGSRAGLWRTGRDQKSPLRRCFEPRPPRRAGSASFAFDCQSMGSGS
jgi:hypothetical protein